MQTTMKDLEWECHSFQNLNNKQLYALLKLRVDVFIVEQQCAYPELDEKDQHQETRHLLAQHGTDVVAYSRLLPPGLSYSEASIGRFVVAETFRKQGLGFLLLTKSLEQITTLWPQKDIKISAQEYLKNFYEKAGFKKISNSYLEDGIPHIEMLKQYSQ